jgi:hypothetical protein
VGRQKTDEAEEQQLIRSNTGQSNWWMQVATAALPHETRKQTSSSEASHQPSKIHGAEHIGCILYIARHHPMARPFGCWEKGSEKKNREEHIGLTSSQPRPPSPSRRISRHLQRFFLSFSPARLMLTVPKCRTFCHFLPRLLLSCASTPFSTSLTRPIWRPSRLGKRRLSDHQGSSSRKLV